MMEFGKINGRLTWLTHFWIISIKSFIEFSPKLNTTNVQLEGRFKRSRKVQGKSSEALSLGTAITRGLQSDQFVLLSHKFQIVSREGVIGPGSVNCPPTPGSTKFDWSVRVP